MSLVMTSPVKKEVLYREVCRNLLFAGLSAIFQPREAAPDIDVILECTGPREVQQHHFDDMRMDVVFLLLMQDISPP